MGERATVDRGHWSGRMAFMLAAVGSAIGLGNLWKFPYIAGVNGGGAFVLVYLACIAVVGIPIFLAELYIGQHSQKNAVQSFEALHRPGTPWRFVGFLGVFSAFVILSFYSVVGGWVLDFEFRSLINQFGHLPPEEIKSYMGQLFGNPALQIFWHFVFMAMTVGIVLGGVKGGLEKWNRILMPSLSILLGILLVYSFFLEGFPKAISFLFTPDASKLTYAGVLEAVGHSFFTLSLGLGAIITYGGYLSEDEGLPAIAALVGFFDTVFALFAGIIIFSVVFTHGMEPGGGPTLMFQTLPMLFNDMPGGYFIQVAFFLLVAFAAMTSSISLLEVVVSYLDDNLGWDRRRSTLIAGASIFILGLLTALSFNVLSNVTVGDLTLFDIKDKLTSNLTLPLGGLLIALYYGWVLGPKAVEASLGRRAEPYFTLILWISRLVAPIAVAIILWNGLTDIYQHVFPSGS